jgi:hypothetical protein
MKVAIQRVSLRSLGKMGCLLGAVAAVLPSLLCGLLGLGLARMVFRWLESWQDLTISLLGQEIARFDMVQFLGLDRLLDALQVLTAVSVPVLLLVVLVLALAAGLVLALIVILVGLAYNLVAAGTGGLVVEMKQVRTQKSAGPHVRQ